MVVDKKLLKVHICGIKIDVYKVKDIFPETCNQKYKGDTYIGDRQWKTEQFNWVAKSYEDNNFKIICDEIKGDSDLNQDTDGINKHIILSFGDENNELLFKEIQKIGLVYLPRIIFITKKIGNYNFKKKSYISNIIYSDLTDENLVSYIKDEIWEIDCYYNERGNATSKYLVSNIVDNIESTISNTSINLLLCGVSRAGKSSFINVINNSLLALENCGKSSLTKKITEYQIYHKNDQKKEGFIKIIDTPGFCYSTNKKTDKEELKNVEEINDGISNLIKKYKEKSSLEDIHFVLFFFLEGTSLEGSQTVLKMFINANYNVLFIINKSIDDSDNGEPADIRALENFLDKNSLEELKIRDNIICCNIIQTKFNGYGINDIFNRIYNILKENNPFYNDKELMTKIKHNINALNDLMDVKGKENEFGRCLKENYEMKKKIAKENSLFETYKSGESLKEIETCRKSCETYISSFKYITASNAIIPIPYTDLALTPTLQAVMIAVILSKYGISITDLNLPFFVETLVGEGGSRLAHLSINHTSKKIFEYTAKGCAKECIKTLSKLLAANQGGKVVSESMKFVPFLGFILGGTIGAALNYYSTTKLGENTVNLAEIIMKKKGDLAFFKKQIEIYKNIFEQIKELSIKKNWWDYEVKVIKK